MNTTKEILTFIIKEKAHGNTFQELNIQMKIMMKGLNIKGIFEGTIPDTPVLFEQLKEIAREFEIDLNKMNIA